MPVVLQLIAGEAWQIYAICDSRGCTFLDTLRLNEKETAKVAATLRRFSTMGPKSIPTERNHIVDQRARLYQLRVDDCRILWFYDEGRVVICCHGYRKKSNKAPPGEIKKGRDAATLYHTAKQQRQVVIKKDED